MSLVLIGIAASGHWRVQPGKQRCQAKLYPSGDVFPHINCSTRVKDTGIAIRHSQERLLFYTAVSRNRLERVGGHGPGHKKEVDPKKKKLFVIEKYVEDVKHDEKHGLDLLEPILRLADPTKEEFRRIFMKMIQFGSKISKIKVSTFWIPEI